MNCRISHAHSNHALISANYESKLHVCYCSGTLSYIFNNFIGKRPFSEVVSEAKEAGYTEPDPRDDLSGTDVARKVLIYLSTMSYSDQNFCSSNRM